MIPHVYNEPDNHSALVDASGRTANALAKVREEAAR